MCSHYSLMLQSKTGSKSSKHRITQRAEAVTVTEASNWIRCAVKLYTPVYTFTPVKHTPAQTGASCSIISNYARKRILKIKTKCSNITYLAFFKKIPTSRASCSFASVLGICNGMATREHLEIKQQRATRPAGLADLPAAGYTPAVRGDWRLP